MSTLGHSSMGNGTALPGMICFAMRTEPVSMPISGERMRPSGWVLTARQLDGALVEQHAGELLDEPGIHHRRRHGAVAEQVVIDARGVHHIA